MAVVADGDNGVKGRITAGNSNGGAAILHTCTGDVVDCTRCRSGGIVTAAAAIVGVPTGVMVVACGGAGGDGGVGTIAVVATGNDSGATTECTIEPLRGK